MDSLYDRLKSVKFLRKLHQWYWKNIRCKLRNLWIYRRYVPVVKMNYKLDLERLRSINHERKVRVYFLVGEIAKWKGQSLFECLSRSSTFEPIIAVHRMVTTPSCPREIVTYFSDRDMPAVDLSSEKEYERFMNSADIVFYQQPWDLPPELDSMCISKRAITFYFPYYMMNSYDIELEMEQRLHHLVYRYIVPSSAVAKDYDIHAQKSILPYAGTRIALGHPIMDAFLDTDEITNTKDLVIYAPHWTIHYREHRPPLKYATFIYNGRLMLEYAKSHPEFNWVFKPHPRLQYALAWSGFMTEEEASEYYAEWAKIGKICTSSEYIPLFKQAQAMITDCGSFLTEFAATGMPIIRPINHELNVEPNPALKDLYATYYNVYSWSELKDTMDDILVRGNDPKSVERHLELQKAQIIGTNAAENILHYLEDLIESK